MSLTLSETAGTFELPPSGPQAARCIRVIDLGTQTSDYQGEAKSARKVLLTWRLDERRSDGEPHQVSRRFTASLHEKAALRAFLKSWRGRDFTPDELSAFDLRKLLGASALLNLTHSQRAGRDYADIASVSPLLKGMQPPPPLGDNEGLLFDISDPATHAVLDDLSERLQDQIKDSPEWRAAHTPAISASRPAQSAYTAPSPHNPPARQSAPAAEFEADDIPF
ncbi:phage replication initiation protein, NGO0469 family [Thiomonas sp.]